MPLEFVDPGPDRETLRPFARRAIDLRSDGVGPIDAWVDHLLREIGTPNGRCFLAREHGREVGLAVWSEGGLLGANVGILYLDGPAASPDRYGELLTEVARRSGPVAFAPGPLAGLRAEDETRAMHSWGYARYGRSEMRIDDPGLAATVPDTGPGGVRPIEPADEPALAVLHRHAYHGRFDRYLFQEEPDEVKDSEREVGQLLHGRWGALEPSGSVVLASEDGRLLADVLAVRRPEGILIADVAVDPAEQGRGLGRRVFSAALRGMAAARAQPVYLNVTEGNERALRLYRSLGFVRTMGPTRDWYSTAAIPVAP